MKKYERCTTWNFYAFLDPVRNCFSKYMAAHIRHSLWQVQLNWCSHFYYERGTFGTPRFHFSDACCVCSRLDSGRLVITGYSVTLP